MNPDVYLIITLLYGDRTIKVAMEIQEGHELFDSYTLDHYMEPENRAKIHSFLPLHVRNCGPIIHIEKDELFDITVLKKGDKPG